MDDSKRQVRSAIVFIILVMLSSLPFYWFAKQPLLPSSMPVYLPASALMAFLPAVFAILLEYMDNGKQGALTLLRTLIDFRRLGVRWLVIAFLVMPAIFVVAYVYMILTGPPLPQPTSITAIPGAFVVLYIFAIGEELGWSGYATAKLQTRWSALNASLLIGLVAVLWHLVPYMLAPRTAMWIVGQSILLMAMRVIIIWLFNSAKGSVILTVVVHTMYNLSYHMFPNAGSHYDPMVVGVVTLIVAVLLVIRFGPQSLAGRSADLRAVPDNS